MSSTTDQGRTIERVESFVVSHTLDPRTGPSIALSSSHAYVLVKLTDADGRSGWGETYLVPGIPAIIEAVAPVLIGRSAAATRELSTAIRWSAEHPYAASAMNIAVEDLRARQLGVSVAESFGGPVRDKVRIYAAFGGYVEGKDPAETWPGDVERVVDAGFTAMKFRVGRYPVAHEAAAAGADPRRPARHHRPDGRRERRLHAAAGDGDGPHPRFARLPVVRGTDAPARDLPGLRAHGRRPRHRARRRRDHAETQRGDRAVRSPGRRHRPARTGDLRRDRRDALDGGARGGPQHRGHAPHLQ